MTINRFKSIAIAALVFLAIYLTLQLWLGNIATRNYLYSAIFSRKASTGSDESYLFSMPYRLITNFGSNRFGIDFNGLASSPAVLECEVVLDDILKEGEFVSASPINYERLFKTPSYIYDYSFDMPVELFAAALGQKPGILSSHLKQFNSIIFAPEEHKTRVFFLDESDEAYYEFISYELMLPVKQMTIPLSFESSELSNLKMFSENVFIAKFPFDSYVYPAIKITNPYMGSDLLMGSMERKIDPFFSNPSAKLYFIGENNIYTFIDENTVVKYFQNDVLDYANYKSARGSSNIIENFDAAIQFLRNDQQVINEFYLAEYMVEGKYITFYFDYCINNLPIILPDEYKRVGAATLKHAIEITLADESVSHYRKLAYNFLEDTATKNASLGFEDALRSAAGDQVDALAGLFSSIDIGYKIDMSKQAYLYWIFKTDRGSLSQKAW